MGNQEPELHPRPVPERRQDSVVELDRAPDTGRLFRRAALGAVPLPGVRRTADTLPETTLVLSGIRVDRTLLAEYDRVCGFGVSDTLPPTFAHVLAFPLAMALMSAPDFPFPMVGLVHVANRIEVRRPIDAGEPLDLAVYCEDLREHPRGRQFDVVSIASVGSEEVCRGVSTYLRRRRGGASGGAAPGTGEHGVGEPAALWRVGARVGSDYAAVSGDRNPIHTSRLGARLFGFPRPIAHGMWSKARCLAALYPRLPAAYNVLVAFKLPILLPATAAFSVDPPRATEPPRGFALHDAKTGRPHLAGTLTPA